MSTDLVLTVLWIVGGVVFAVYITGFCVTATFMLANGIRNGDSMWATLGVSLVWGVAWPLIFVPPISRKVIPDKDLDDPEF